MDDSSPEILITLSMLFLEECFIEGDEDGVEADEEAKLAVLIR